MLKKILPLALWLTATVAAFGQNAVMVNRSNSIITYPSNFWTANALVGRSGLGFNTNLNAFWAATNAATARTAIGALATNGNGSALTNLTASNITGTLAISNGGSGATTAGGARTNLGLGATNEVTFGSVRSSGLFVSIGTNDYFYAADDMVEVYVPMTIYGTYGISFATNEAAAQTRTNLSLGASWLTNTTAANFRTDIGALATNGDGSGLTNLPAASFSGTLAISNGGSGATTAGGARTNFGLGWSALTSPQSSLYSGTATTLLGYMPEIIAGGTNPSGFNVLAYTNTEGLVIPANLVIGEDQAPAPRNMRHVEIYGTATISHPYTDDTILGANYASVTDHVNFTNTIATWSSNALTMEMPIAFSTNTAAATTRTNLGLGTAATNPASAFQPSSSVLTNLANNNGSSLTNLSAAGVVGILATNGNGAGLTNLTASNITGTIAISNGGSGATTAGGARTNFGLGNFDNVTFDSLILGGTTNTLGVYDFYAPNAKFDGIEIGGYGLEIDEIGNLTLFTALYFNNSTNAAITRTNLGLGATWLTNANVTNFRTAIGLGTTNTVSFSSVEAAPSSLGNLLTNTTINDLGGFQFRNIGGGGNVGSAAWYARYPGVTTVAFAMGQPSKDLIILQPSQITFTTNVFMKGALSFEAFDPGLGQYNDYAAMTRTNLGIGWSALTNTNTAGFNASAYGSGTNPVLYNTNGEVVSPTNFWQVAPVNTVVQYSQPVVSSTNAATNGRNIYLYSLAISTVGITNTVTLPTNSATFYGDVATIIHEGPTSSFTAIRQAGSATNIISLNQFQEAVQFIYNGGGWKLADNISQVEPLYFSGTNAAAHAAASRTNLGLGGGITTNLVLKNGANVDTYLNFSNGILKYGSTVAP